MITEVGIVAGEIWNYLDKNGKVSLKKLISNIEKPRDIILMSLGWLAREGHISIADADGKSMVSLRK